MKIEEALTIIQQAVKIAPMNWDQHQLAAEAIRVVQRELGVIKLQKQEAKEP